MKLFCVTNVIPLLLFAVCAGGQTAQVQTRLRGRINRDQATVLAGHVHPLAQAAFDQGPVAGSFVLPSVTMYIQPSPAQKAALAGLLASQQNPKSPLFHQMADARSIRRPLWRDFKADYQQLRDWLSSEGFVLSPEARGRRSITFPGNGLSDRVHI